MKKLILFVLLIQCFCFAHLWGQETKTIQGKIIDENGESLIGATVFVKGTTKGTTTGINGTFHLTASSADTLIISFIGYVTQKIKPRHNMTIVLQPDMAQIDEVVVTAQKSMVEVTADKTTVYPSLSPTTASGNAYSVLKNLPGVIINSDGTIYMNGKSGVKILVDGKNSYLSGTDLVNYLMSLPATSLNRIELINHPSAKYEAAGNAGIIDICTQRTNLFGYNLNLNTNYEQGEYGRSNSNISFGFRQNKWNITGMYGYYQGGDYVDLTINRDYPETTNTPLTYFDQDSYRRRKYKSHYGNLAIDYYATKKTTIGINIRGNTTNHIENGTINSLFYSATTTNDSTVTSLTDNDETQRNLTSSLYVQHKIDSLGKEISASVDGLYYSINEAQYHNDVLSRPNGTSSESVSQALKDGSIKMVSGRADLAYPVNKQWCFDAGIKSDFVNINNMSDYQNQENGQWIINPDLSTDFYYKENINAVYVSSKYETQKFMAEVGLRIENTNIEGDSLDQSYINFFPNMMLSWHFANSNALNFTYDRRIDRPNYKDLNPFVYVFDEYTYEQGNTELQPQFTDRINLSYTIRKAYKISVFYTNTQDAIIKSYFIEEDSKRVWVMPTNMSSYHSYGIQGDAGNLKFIDWLQTSLHTELVQNNYDWIENGSTIKNKNLTFQVGIQNRIKLPWGWNGEISGFYNSRMAYGQMDVLPLWQISGGIQRNFFDGNATLNIFSNDWFHSNRTRAEGVINGSFAKTNEFDDHSILGISFTYRFKKGLDVKKVKGGKQIETKRISL